MSNVDRQTEFLQHKDSVIQRVLQEEDLYKIVGASRTATAQELRRCYLERSQIVHPDKLPFHPDSTSAFQRLGFAFDILKSSSSRRTYDRASKPTSCSLPDKTSFLGGDHTFRTAVAAVLHEFMTGDFLLVREWFGTLQKQYPNLITEELGVTLEKSFLRLRELVLTTRSYALIIYIELGRINRVQKKLLALGYFDVLGRTKLIIHLVRVTLAVPVRVDRALRQREEKAWRAECAGLQARGIVPVEEVRSAGIMNERVYRVLELIVGDAGKDEGADEAWGRKMDAKTAYWL
ncbi:putative DnaJ like protein subfamily B member 11 [Calycina marina]|uniref:DnaJ like protein subfamily B member 11 n=1 Tax=Calycina marina TaxID=1763456 RepID=A0A9P7YYF8_9HELO|nr:putative DnaJ like protein subfamily B member 11 [Calycina marina]